MTEQLQNPHDKVFKEVFSDITIAKDFIQNYIPTEIAQFIELDSITRQKDSFIDEKLKESFSDLIFKVKMQDDIGYISILFEHKSYPTDDIAIQLLRYMCNIWEAMSKKEKMKKLPVILPIVIYHGKKSWNIEPSLAGILDGYHKLPETIRLYIPNFKYLLYDLTKYTEEELKGNAQLRFFFNILQTVQTKSANDFLENFLIQITQLYHLENQIFVQFVNPILYYISTTKQNLDKQQYERAIQTIEQNYEKGDEKLVTWAELFREEGFEQGEQKQAVKMLIKLLTKKFGILPNEMQEKIQALDITVLEIITDEIFQFEALDDVQKYLKL